MKKLTCLIGLFMIVGCVKAYALPGKRIIGGFGVGASSNTYISATFNSDGSQNVSGSTTTAALFTDSRYDGYTSTGTAGALTSTGTISNIPTIITDYSFLVRGGDATITFSGLSGSINIRNGIPYDRPVVAIPLVSNTIILTTLTSGATVDYTINGGN
jgi:hypothetical protein